MAGGAQDKKPCKTSIGTEFRVCPECGYENGFHNMFVPRPGTASLDWLFICPNCSSRWDIGLTVRREI
jgi:hypothetical protein